MTARIINGREIARELRTEVTTEVRRLWERYGISPGLAVVLVGDDTASATYVRNKELACQEVGIVSETFRLPTDANQDQVCSLVDRLNHDPRFHGVLVQLPLPVHMDSQAVIDVLSPDKDVDALHPTNLGHLMRGTPRFLPCTPAGIQELLKRSGISPDHEHVVVCGRSDIVGKPMAVLLMQKRSGANATVTVCHTGTQDLGRITRQASILIAAMGRPASIKGDMVKPGAVVVDVGINRIEDASTKRGYRLVGDVDFQEVAEVAAAITPVPGGVGPMTVAMLIQNTLNATRYSLGEKVNLL
jgi:methylenetetrahydrofolate dehydrogenase (NADP+)/methenyltetrahydrofolate cyclohydrolase